MANDRLTETLESLLIVRGGIARSDIIISTSYKNLVEPPFDCFVSKLNAQVSVLLHILET